MARGWVFVCGCAFVCVCARAGGCGGACARCLGDGRPACVPRFGVRPRWRVGIGVFVVAVAVAGVVRRGASRIACARACVYR